MQIQRVIFRNYRQHKNASFELKPGVNGVIGPNGAGKSNLVRGIQFLLTGAFARTEGADGLVAMSRNITWGEETGQLECEFIHNGIPGTIRRSLHTSSCRLTYGKEIKLTRAVEVNAFINSMMGTSSRVIGQYVFTHQNATAKVLNAKSSERAAMFSVLFNTDRCERLREMLNAEMSAQAPSDLSFSSGMLRDSIGQTAARLKELHGKIAVLQQKMSTVDEPKERSQLITAKASHETYYNVTTGYVATQQQLAGIEQQEVELSRNMQATQANLQQLGQSIEQLEKDLVHHRSMVSQAAQAGQIQLRRNALTLKLTELEKSLATLRAGTPVGVYASDEDVATCKKQLEGVKGELLTLHRLVTNLSGGSGRCPTCGTHHVTTAEGTLQTFAAVLTNAQVKIAELEPWATQAQSWVTDQELSKKKAEAAHAAWVVRQNETIAALEATRTNLTDLPDLKVVDDRESQAVIQQHKAAKEQHQLLTRQLTATTDRLNYLRTQQEHQTKWLAQLTTISLVDYSETETRIKDWDTWRSEVLTLQGQQTELEKAQANCQSQLDKLQLAEQRSDSIRRYRDTLSTVIGVLHKDNYPAAVARLHFKTINHAWNVALGLLGQPYQAQILPDQTIQLQFPGGLGEFYDASGGQQCCAAIAYLWAANQQFASEAGMMFLDEPTSGIDADHIPMVADMFMNMQRAAVNANLQVVVVTHDERLTRGCGHVVQLSS